MENTTRNNTTTNDLRHTISATTTGGERMRINIRLNDECKNGHQDFSITGDIYDKRGQIDRCGCLHDEILTVKPELKIFVDLHLSDAKGVPMYAVENGFYHLRKGFNNTPVWDEDRNIDKFAAKFCEYYRITLEQFAVLNQSESQTQFAMNIQKLGILDQWQAQADEAIKILEDWTGQTFFNDSVKSQFHAPTQAEIDFENEQIESGYYSPEAEEARAQNLIDIEFDKLKARRDREIELANNECDIKTQVLQIAGKVALDNCIIYTHSKQLGFNWSTSNKAIEQPVIDEIAAKINLPEGFTILNKG